MTSRLFPLCATVVSFIYFCLVSVREYTWLFASGDSGDWMFASTWWTAPQPYGSPLYISLGHLLQSLGADLPVHMTLLLSSLPAAITVGLVYSIVLTVTGKHITAAASSLVLTGMGVFMSQATVLEQYSLAVMFLALAIWFTVRGHSSLTYLAMGLGTAVHVMIAPVAFFWLVIQTVERRNWRTSVKPVLIYLVTGLAPYSLILWLLAHGDPPLLAGYGLSLQSINSYLGSTSVVGSLAIQAAPERILTDFLFIVVGYSAALVPIWIALKREWRTTLVKLLAVSLFFPVWYTVTCIDPTTWVFLIWGSVAAAGSRGGGIRGWRSSIPIASSISIL